jgi:hypothetical protein
MFTSMTNYVYNLNEDAQVKIDRLNKLFFDENFASIQKRSDGFEYYRYVGLQIRRTDKVLEYPKEVWNWLNNSDNVLNEVMPYVIDTGIKRLVIVSDDCSYVAELYVNIFKIWGNKVEVRSTCFDPIEVTGDISSLLQSRRQVGRNDKPNHAISVFADIELLRKSEHFFGLFNSNIVRWVARLRSRHFSSDYTHALAVSVHNADTYLRMKSWIT